MSDWRTERRTCPACGGNVTPRTCSGGKAKVFCSAKCRRLQSERRRLCRNPNRFLNYYWSNPEKQRERCRRKRNVYSNRRRKDIAAACLAFARESGWPYALAPTAVAMLNVLAAVGLPLTVREIRGFVGRPLGYAVRNLMSFGLATHDAGRHGKKVWSLSPLALSILEERAKCETSEKKSPPSKP